MDKRKGKTQYDEYFSDGIVELGRIGNVVTLKNNMSEEQADMHREKLADDYDEKKMEIDNLIAEIRKNISLCNPLRLLQFAADKGMSTIINVVSEFEIGDEINILRSVEFIQSILVSQESQYACSEDEDQTELMEKIIRQIDELYTKIQAFYTYWGAKELQKNDLLSKEDINYIVEWQLMSNVRGKRYQFQQLNNIEALMKPHSEIMEEIYGTSASEFIEGLRKLEYSLSSAKLDAAKRLYLQFEKFQNDAEGKSDSEIEELLEKSRKDIHRTEILNKLFGVDLYDVKKVTNWDDRLINSLSYELGECKEFIENGEFAAWPNMGLPIQKKPFIKINGHSYCFDYYSLFDNIYRVIQKDIKSHDSEYVTEWSKRQQFASETLVENIFKNILPGCRTFVGNYYPKNHSLKQMDENDLLILYEDVLIIVEVKAGAFTYTPAITDLPAHKKSFEALIGKAEYQCERTLAYINENEQAVFYDHDKKEKITFEKKQFNKVYTFCVTVDNFNTFEAGIEKINFLKINSGTIAISIDDLEIYEKYFESPLYFMHFLEQRKEATKIKQLTLRDELDHLGMYIAHNVYSKSVNEFKECTLFTASGYRQDLDYYFASLHCEEIEAIKPMQKIPERIQEIISFVEKSVLPNKVSFTSFLLNFSTDAKDEFSGKIDYVLNRQRQTKYMAPLIAFGEAAYGCFIKQPGVAELSEEKQLEYMYANMLKVGKKKYWYILLTFDAADILMDVSYKELSLDNIEKDGYVRSQLMERAEEIFQNRVRMVLEKEHRKKIYPNDMCPCGSGRKYKKCCGKSK